MNPWPKHPIIYEINTWTWLGELSRKHGRSVALGSVPSEEWDLISSLGVDAIWFMGVWQRSPAGIGIALQNQGLLEDFRRALPDYSAEDIVGSPYCVRNYRVDEQLGGPAGLVSARNILRERGIRLVLDFVPNHVAPDHSWASEHPEYFIRGTADDVARDPASFFESRGNIFACGKDPFFPAWPDVLQLNAFNQGLRQAIIRTVSDIAEKCDAVRCDMAMLMLNNIFERTWGERAGAKPADDYWTTLIPAIKTMHQDFRFIAEAYWDLEWELQQQGFDFCYDKKLYDRLEHGAAEDIRLHLCAAPEYQQRLIRFIENHDEPRAASVFAGPKGRAAAVASLTLTGAKLLHEGQSEGLKMKLPVFLGRRPVEEVDHDLSAFYRGLLQAVSRDIFKNGQWRLCGRTGWPDNQTSMNILAWSWEKDKERCLVIINYSDRPAQALVHMSWDDLAGKTWRLNDILSGGIYDRSGDDMRDAGLYIDLGPWGFHLFSVSPL